MKLETYRTTAEFQAAFAELAKMETKQEQQAAKHRAKLAALEQKHSEAAAPLAEQIEAKRAAIAAYAESHRAELTDNGKTKTAAIGKGCLKWRKSPPKLEVTGDTAAIITALKRRKLGRFIRTKEELDKAAILKEAAAIKTPIAGLAVIDGCEILTIQAKA